VTRQEFIAKFETLVEVDPGTLTGDSLLGQDIHWDSMAIVGFIAMVDENMGFTPAPKDIVKSKTVNDLISIVSLGIKG
jgi:acyl carrier protein